MMVECTNLIKMSSTYLFRGSDSGWLQNILGCFPVYLNNPNQNMARVRPRCEIGSEPPLSES